MVYRGGRPPTACLYLLFLLLVITVLSYSSLTVSDGLTLTNSEELEPPVQGPINREPDEKLFPERFVQKESGIRKL